MTNNNMTPLITALAFAALAGTLVSCSSHNESTPPKLLEAVAHVEATPLEPIQIAPVAPDIEAPAQVAVDPAAVPHFDEIAPTTTSEAQDEPAAVIEDEPVIEDEYEPIDEPLPTCDDGFTLAEDLTCVPNTFWDPQPPRVSGSAPGVPCGDNLVTNWNGDCTDPAPQPTTTPDLSLELVPTPELDADFTNIPGISLD